VGPPEPTHPPLYPWTLFSPAEDSFFFFKMPYIFLFDPLFLDPLGGTPGGPLTLGGWVSLGA